MIWFPQLSTGSLVQFPSRGTHRLRPLVNSFESGEEIAITDEASAEIQWRLALQDLADDETARIVSLHANCRGSFQSFGFVDPFSNLLGNSEDFSQAEWQAGAMSITHGFGDPIGGTTAWKVANSTVGLQSLEQTLGLPGSFCSTFSIYARADTPTVASISCGNDSQQIELGVNWKRHSVTSTAGGPSEMSTFSLHVGAGMSAYCWGAQVDAQPYASGYNRSELQRGIFKETRFASDELWLTTRRAGMTSCTLELVSRL